MGAPHRQRDHQGHPDAEARAGLFGDPTGEHGGPQRPDHGRRGRGGAGDEGGAAQGADAAVDGGHQEDGRDVGGPGRHREAHAAAGQLGRLGPGDVRGQRVERAGHDRVGEPGGAHRGHGGAAGLQDVAGQQGVVHAVPPGWLGEPAEQEPAEAGGQHGRDRPGRPGRARAGASATAGAARTAAGSERRRRERRSRGATVRPGRRRRPGRARPPAPRPRRPAARAGAASPSRRRSARGRVPVRTPRRPSGSGPGGGRARGARPARWPGRWLPARSARESPPRVTPHGRPPDDNKGARDTARPGRGGEGGREPRVLCPRPFHRSARTRYGNEPG